MQAEIERQLEATIPDGKRGALIVVVDERGSHFGVAARLGEGWRLDGTVGTTWGGDVSGRAVLTGSW